MENIQTPQELENRLNRNLTNEVLIDVRSPEEYQESHIDKAININVGDMKFVEKINQLDKDKTYIIYCKSGGRSQMASMIMEQNGLNVINCLFGIMSLQDSNIKMVIN